MRKEHVSGSVISSGTLSTEARLALLYMVLITGHSKDDILKNTVNAVQTMRAQYERNPQIQDLSKKLAAEKYDIEKKLGVAQATASSYQVLVNKNQSEISSHQHQIKVSPAEADVHLAEIVKLEKEGQPDQKNFNDSMGIVQSLTGLKFRIEQQIQMNRPPTVEDVLSDVVSIQRHEFTDNPQSKGELKAARDSLLNKLQANANPESVNDKGQDTDAKQIRANALLMSLARSLQSPQRSGEKNVSAAKEEMRVLKAINSVATTMKASTQSPFENVERICLKDDAFSERMMKQTPGVFKDWVNNLSEYVKMTTAMLESSGASKEINVENFTAILQKVSDQKKILEIMVGNPGGERHEKQFEQFEKLEGQLKEVSERLNPTRDIRESASPNVEAESKRTWDKMAERYDGVVKFIAEAKQNPGKTSFQAVDDVLSKMDKIVQGLHKQLQAGEITHQGLSAELVKQFAALAQPLMEMQQSMKPKNGQVQNFMRARLESIEAKEVPKQVEESRVESPRPK